MHTINELDNTGEVSYLKICYKIYLHKYPIHNTVHLGQVQNMYHIKNCTKNVAVQLNNQQIILVHKKMAYERHMATKRLIIKRALVHPFFNMGIQHTVYRITSTF